ncbi:acyl carrier protein [Nocardia terpenica]|uniref:Acyl carrier protein n=1 Tax=Nocardia terpenica TaxID=455432 RepID=A0A6G9YYS2_9NOCA|nr:acyl carrier protein [Nocardia terpenica]QIS18465.1 acyl carrier protein [Nocardia terpenica]
MTVLTSDSLKEIMQVVAHDPELAFDDNFLDTEFGEYDFDSLAVLELVTRIQKQCNLTIPDDVLEKLATPRDLLDYVSQQVGVSKK